MGTVRVERDGASLIATLDSPPHALMDEGMAAGLDELVGRAEADESVRAVVLTNGKPLRYGRFLRLLGRITAEAPKLEGSRMSVWDPLVGRPR
jgi:enoyl-CoA hydratase/carnithine racemase